MRGGDDGLGVVDGPAAADVVSKFEQHLEGQRVRLHHLPAHDLVAVVGPQSRPPPYPASQRRGGARKEEQQKKRGAADHVARELHRLARGAGMSPAFFR